MVSIWSKRGRIALGVFGLILVSAPVIGAQVLIAIHSRDQARRVVDETAKDFVARAETAIDNGLIALTDLAIAGVTSCSEHDLDVMRRTVYSNFWIKEVGIVDGNGQIACNHIGDRITVRPLSERYPSRNDDISVQLVELGSNNRAGVMLIWSLSDEGGLSAIVPSGAMTDAPVPKYLRSVADGRMELADGQVIGRFQRTQEAPPPDDDLISTQAASQRYPIVMKFAAPYETFVAVGSDLMAYAKFGGALASTMIFGLLVYVLRGPPIEIAKLRDAAARGEFVPYYQPVIDIGSGRLVGCEVLMRWAKPDGTVVAPDAFIRQAEASGLAGPMTLSLMRRVLSDLAEPFGQRRWLKISINLFNWHFNSLKTVRDVEHIFGRTSIAYDQLIFELTERQPLNDIDRARVVIRRFQQLGARVALDDAGTGHSGLAYLHQLGVDVVKIDKLFVDTIRAGNAASPIVDSLIRLGHDLGMEVIAEGVESFDQLDYLRAHGADAAQGYLFSPPLPAGPFLDLVKAMEPAAAGARIEMLPPRSRQAAVRVA